MQVAHWLSVAKLGLPTGAIQSNMKKVNKEKHRKKMAKLRRKMLAAWATKRAEKAQKTRNKIIKKTVEFNNENQ